MYCLLRKTRGMGREVKSIFPTQFTLSCLLFVSIWFKKTYISFSVLIQISPNHPCYCNPLQLSTREYCERNVNEKELKGRATHLMRAFLNTCSEFYIKKTENRNAFCRFAYLFFILKNNPGISHLRNDGNLEFCSKLENK